MRETRAMAVLARNSRDQRFRSPVRLAYGAAGVAAETLSSFQPTHHTTGSLLQITRLQVSRSHRQIETIQGLVKTYTAFIHIAVSLKHVCLPGFPKAECV